MFRIFGRSSQRPVRIVVMGHNDSGKSTILGHFIPQILSSGFTPKLKQHKLEYNFQERSYKILFFDTKGVQQNGVSGWSWLPQYEKQFVFVVFSTRSIQSRSFASAKKITDYLLNNFRVSSSKIVAIMNIIQSNTKQGQQLNRKQAQAFFFKHKIHLIKRNFFINSKKLDLQKKQKNKQQIMLAIMRYNMLNHYYSQQKQKDKKKTVQSLQICLIGSKDKVKNQFFKAVTRIQMGNSEKMFESDQCFKVGSQDVWVKFVLAPYFSHEDKQTWVNNYHQIRRFKNFIVVCDLSKNQNQNPQEVKTAQQSVDHLRRQKDYQKIDNYFIVGCNAQEISNDYKLMVSKHKQYIGLDRFQHQNSHSTVTMFCQNILLDRYRKRN